MSDGILKMATPVMDNQGKSQFEINPKRFIEEVTTEFVATSQLNRLEDFDGAPIFEAPLIGYADGDDLLFEEYKKVVHKNHYTPREILTKYLSETLKIEAPVIADVSVISFVLPYNSETLRTNAREKEGPSLRWNHTRWKGQDFNHELSKHLVPLLRRWGSWPWPRI